MLRQQQLTATEEHNFKMQGLDLQSKGDAKEADVVQHRNKVEAATVKSKAEAEATAVEAQKALEMARVTKANDVEMAKVRANAERQKVQGEAEKSVAQFQAEGEVATFVEKTKAEIEALQQKAQLMKDNPQLLELLSLEAQARVQESYALAAKENPNVSLGLTEEHAQQIRRMNHGFTPLQPVIPMGGAIVKQAADPNGVI